MALVFDGVDDLLTGDATDDIFKENAAMTYYSKFLLTTISATASARFFDRSAGGGSVLAAIGATTGTLSFEVDGTVNLLVVTTTALVAGTEYVVIVTWDGSTTATNAHIYINGVEASYATQTNGTSPADNSAAITYIFNRADGARGLIGTAREVAIFSQVISSSAIGALSTAVSTDIPLTIPGCVRYWRMQGGINGASADGQLIRDTSGSGRNLTADNGANNTGMTWQDETLLSEIKLRRPNCPTGTRMGSRQTWQ